MCSFSKPSIPPPQAPPAPEPTPPTPPVVVQATTKRNAPKMAESASAIGLDTKVEKANSTSVRKKRGRGSLRIPLTSSGLAGSGINFPTA